MVLGLLDENSESEVLRLVLDRYRGDGDVAESPLRSEIRRRATEIEKGRHAREAAAAAEALRAAEERRVHLAAFREAAEKANQTCEKEPTKAYCSPPNTKQQSFFGNVCRKLFGRSE
jgi:hypothetical protein